MTTSTLRRSPAISEELRNAVISAALNRRSRIVCPECNHTRSRHNQGSTDLSVTAFPDRAVYKCHHCEIGGVVPYRETHRMEAPVAPHPAEVRSQDRRELKIEPLSQKAIEYLEARGITAAVAHEQGLFSTRVYFRKLGTEGDGIGFPYRQADTKHHYATKIRSIDTKDFSCHGSPQSFFGIERVERDAETVVIVEGEFDALAYAVAGVTAISVPHGAGSLPMGKTDGRHSAFLANAEELLSKAKKVIIATDADKSGEPFGEELARRIGMMKCWKVNFHGYKDANEVLLNLGSEALADTLIKATPWPIDGLFGAAEFEEKVSSLFHEGFAAGASTGFTNLDSLYTIAPGRVTVVTGVPGHGKSEFIDQVMINVAEEFGWSLGVCSFENQPEHHITKLLAKRARKPFFKGKGRRMSEEEMKSALDWMKDHFVFLDQRNGDLTPVEWIIERARAAVLKYGIRGLVIDPYNYIAKGAEIETEWVSTLLTRLRSFAIAYKLHIWFVAHPTKIKPKEDGTYPVCGGYDISGSAAWYAKTDFGVTVWRNPLGPDPSAVTIQVWKCRFQWEGSTGEAYMVYEPETTRYRESVTPGAIYSVAEKKILEGLN